MNTNTTLKDKQLELLQQSISQLSTDFYTRQRQNHEQYTKDWAKVLVQVGFISSPLVVGVPDVQSLYCYKNFKSRFFIWCRPHRQHAMAIMHHDGTDKTELTNYIELFGQHYVQISSAKKLIAYTNKLDKLWQQLLTAQPKIV